MINLVAPCLGWGQPHLKESIKKEKEKEKVNINALNCGYDILFTTNRNNNHKS